MKVAVIRFPGANCDQDAFHALRDDLGVETHYVWHEETSLAGFDAAFVPGGFTYGDYLRVGAMAARAPIMQEINRFAREERPVIGVCNGFQILTEAGILPGALMPNGGEKFVCKFATLGATSRSTIWTEGIDRPLRIPVAHYVGRYYCRPEELRMLQDEDRIAFRYAPAREGDANFNVNGSLDNIAGIVNKAGNVLGIMPHPERATRPARDSTDGLLILRALTLLRA